MSSSSRNAGDQAWFLADIRQQNQWIITSLVVAIEKLEARSQEPIFIWLASVSFLIT
jgi:hypothetical protein